jgi:hypothetical protein
MSIRSFALATDHDRDVARVEKGFDPLQASADGVAPPHRERVTIGVKPLPVKSGKGIADRDHHVDRASELRREDRRTPPRHHVDPDIRRQLRDLSISGGIRSSTARSGIIRRNWRSLRAASNASAMNRERT